MEEARGNGQTEQSADKASSRKNGEVSGTGAMESVQHGGSSTSSSLAIPSSSGGRADARTEKSARTKGKDHGACRSTSQDERNLSRRSTKAAPVQLLQLNDWNRDTEATTLEWLMTSWRFQVESKCMQCSKNSRLRR